MTMFHVKHPRTLLASVLLASTLLVGCTGELTPAKGWAPPVAGPNNTLLIQSGAGRIAAIKTDGSPVASFELKGAKTRDFIGRESQAAATPFYATPIVEGNTAYIVSYQGRVARLNLEGGSITERWVVDLNHHVVATPVLRDNRLYVSTENGRLAVVNVENGSIVGETRPTPGRVWGSPAAADDRVFIGTLDSSEILAVQAGNGSTLWRYDGDGATAADLVVDGSTLLVPSFDRAIHALDLASGKESWAFPGDGWFVGKPLVTPGAIYAGTMSGSLYAIDRSGKQQWQFHRAGLEFRATPLLANGTLVGVSRNGTFVGLDAATGAEKWSRTFEGVEIDANGLMLDNAIFFTTHTYRLLRLDPATGEIQPVNVQPPSSGN